MALTAKARHNGLLYLYYIIFIILYYIIIIPHCSSAWLAATPIKSSANNWLDSVAWGVSDAALAYPLLPSLQVQPLN